MPAEQGRISKHPDVRREELLATAFELFMSVGYQKTSVQMITERIGVAKGLFYHYFDSKADLLNEVASWQADQMMTSLPQVSQMEGDALDKLRDVIGSFVTWKLDDARQLIAAYMKVMYRPENASLRIAVIQESIERITPTFAEIIAEGVEEGICDVSDPSLAAEMVFNLWIGGSEKLAELLLATAEHPQNVDIILSRLRGWESAVERLLGIEPDTLNLYDYEYLGKALLALAETETEQEAIPPPAVSA